MIDQGELFSIPNPCRGVCTSNNRGYCKGCLRSRQERFHWNEFSAFQQQLIINLCEKRRQKILADRLATQLSEDDDAAPDQFDLFMAAAAPEIDSNPPAPVQPQQTTSADLSAPPRPAASGEQFDLF